MAGIALACTGRLLLLLLKLLLFPVQLPRQGMIFSR